MLWKHGIPSLPYHLLHSYMYLYRLILAHWMNFYKKYNYRGVSLYLI